jgi:hypothetical protein
MLYLIVFLSSYGLVVNVLSLFNVIVFRDTAAGIHTYMHSFLLLPSGIYCNARFREFFLLISVYRKTSDRSPRPVSGTRLLLEHVKIVDFLFILRYVSLIPGMK